MNPTEDRTDTLRRIDEFNNEQSAIIGELQNEILHMAQEINRQSRHVLPSKWKDKLQFNTPIKTDERLDYMGNALRTFCIRACHEEVQNGLRPLHKKLEEDRAFREKAQNRYNVTELRREVASSIYGVIEIAQRAAILTPDEGESKLPEEAVVNALSASPFGLRILDRVDELMREHLGHDDTEKRTDAATRRMFMITAGTFAALVGLLAAYVYIKIVAPEDPAEDSENEREE